MKGSRILGFTALFFSGVAFSGFLQGHTHTLAIAIPSAILAMVLLSKKTFKR